MADRDAITRPDGRHDPAHDALAPRLLRAADSDELRLRWLPKRTPAGALLGVEALLRWEPTQGGWVPPARFLPLAEAMGLMPRLGDWALDEACRQLREWRAARVAVPRVSVNLSRAELMEPTLPARVAQALARHDLEPGDLELEVAWRALLAGSAEIDATLAKLRELGARLAVDGVGRGAVPSILSRAPVDAFELDRGVVGLLVEHGERRRDGAEALLRSLAQLARRRRVEVVGEGVERERQRDVLVGLGCDALQGHLWGEPVDPWQLQAPATPTGA